MRTVRTIVVDDEPAARARLVRLLAADPDIELVAECRNGAEALEAIRTQAIDLAFLDIQMPQTSGIDVEVRYAAHLTKLLAALRSADAVSGAERL